MMDYTSAWWKQEQDIKENLQTVTMVQFINSQSSYRTHQDSAPKEAPPSGNHLFTLCVTCFVLFTSIGGCDDYVFYFFGVCLLP